MASLDILCFNPFDLKNEFMKIEHKKKLRSPSKVLKNILWPINVCLKYFMAPTKTLRPHLLHTYCTVPKTKVCRNNFESCLFWFFLSATVYTNSFTQTCLKTPYLKSNSHKISIKTSKRTTYFQKTWNDSSQKKGLFSSILWELL